MNNQYSVQVPHSIRVVGQGDADLSPDVVRLRVTVEVARKSAAQAQAETVQIMERVYKAITSAGVDEHDVGTLRHQVGPHYQGEGRFSDRGLKQKGFEASNTVIATVRSPEDVGKVMDSVVRAGATAVVLEYDHTVPEQARSLARERAVANAKRKAEHLASLLGVAVGALIEVIERESLWDVRPTTLVGAPVTEPFATPFVRPSDLRVSVSVEVAYHIRHSQGADGDLVGQ